MCQSKRCPVILFFPKLCDHAIQGDNTANIIGRTTSICKTVISRRLSAVRKEIFRWSLTADRWLLFCPTISRARFLHVLFANKLSFLPCFTLFTLVAVSCQSRFSRKPFQLSVTRGSRHVDELTTPNSLNWLLTADYWQPFNWLNIYLRSHNVERFGV